MDQKNFSMHGPKKFFSMHGPTGQPTTHYSRTKTGKTQADAALVGQPASKRMQHHCRKPGIHSTLQVAEPAAEPQTVAGEKNETGKTTELTGFGIRRRARNHRRQHFLHRAVIGTVPAKPNMWCITRICPPCTPQNPQHASYFLSVFIGLTRAKSMW